MPVHHMPAKYSVTIVNMTGTFPKDFETNRPWASKGYAVCPVFIQVMGNTGALMSGKISYRITAEHRGPMDFIGRLRRLYEGF